MKFNKWTLALAATGVVSFGAFADEHPVNTLLTSTTLSGYVDTAAIWNFGRGNGVASRFANTGADRQDGFNLNAVKLALEKPLSEGTWSSGYKVETWLGPDAAALPGALGGGTQAAIKQAYVALQAPVGNGIQFKVGQFDPIVGYEVADSYANPNFSRSFGFALEPLGHQGVLATYQFTDLIGASAGVANTFAAPGLNTKAHNIGAGVESEKAYMGGITIKAPESTGWLSGSSLYAGIVEGPALGKDTMNLYVGATLSTPWKELTTGASYDYVANGGFSGSYANAVAGYVSYQATEQVKLNARGEYATSSGGIFTGRNDEKVVAGTFTVDYALWQNVVSRAEFRWDHVAGGAGLTGLGNGNERNDLSVAFNVIYKF